MRDYNNTVKDKAIIETIIKDSFAYFSMDTYFVGIHWIRLAETNPMNSHKVGLDAEFTRIIMESTPQLGRCYIISGNISLTYLTNFSPDRLNNYNSC